MKRFIALLAGAGLCAGAWAAEDRPLELKSETDRINYSLGYQIGGDFKSQGIGLSPEARTHARPLLSTSPQTTVPAHMSIEDWGLRPSTPLPLFSYKVGGAQGKQSELQKSRPPFPS